jgi:hypothetical protein
VLQIFKSKNPLILIALLGLAVLVQYKWLIQPEVYQGKYLYNYIQKNTANIFDSFRKASPLGYALASVLSLLVISLFLNLRISALKLYGKNNFAPVIIFMLVALCVRPWWGLHIHHLVLLGSIQIIFTCLQLAQTSSPKSKLFNLGLICGFMGLLWFPAHLYLFIIYAALLSFRAFNIKEWIVVLLGFIAVYYFLLSYLFISVQFEQAANLLPQIKYYWLALPGFTLNLQVILIGASLLLLIGFANVQVSLRRQLMQVRKAWGFFSLCAVIIVITILLSMPDFYLWSILILPFISLYLSSVFSYPTKKFVQWAVVILLIGLLSYFSFFRYLLV